MIREVGLIALIVGAWFGIRWLLKQPRNVQWRWVGICAIIILLGLAVTGKMHWIFAAVAAAVPLIRRLFGADLLSPVAQGLPAPIQCIGTGIFIQPSIQYRNAILESHARSGIRQSVW